MENMGTKMGARINHLAEPLIMKRFSVPQRRMKRSSRGIPPRLRASRASAPLTARMVVRLLVLKSWMNMDAGRAMTRKLRLP